VVFKTFAPQKKMAAPKQLCAPPVPSSRLALTRNCRYTFNAGKPAPASFETDVATLAKSKSIDLSAGITALNVELTSGKTMRICTPPLVLKFGVNSSYEGRASKPTIQLEIPSTDEFKPFHDAMAMLSTKLEDIAVENASDLFSDKSKQKEAVVRSNFSGVIKSGEKIDKKTGKVLATYPDSFRIKISLVKDTPESEYDNAEKYQIAVEDKDGNSIDKAQLNQRNLKVMALFDVRGMMSSKTGVSPQLMLSRVRILEVGAAADEGADAWGVDSEVINSSKRQKIEPPASPGFDS